MFQFLSLHITEKCLKKWKIKVNQSQVIAHNVYRPERPLPCSQYQPNYHTSDRSSKIPRTTIRLQVKLEKNTSPNKEHIAKQRKQIDLTKEIMWLIGKNPIYL
jgi:hypothetical protein